MTKKETFDLQLQSVAHERLCLSSMLLLWCFCVFKFFVLPFILSFFLFGQQG